MVPKNNTFHQFYHFTTFEVAFYHPPSLTVQAAGTMSSNSCSSVSLLSASSLDSDFSNLKDSATLRASAHYTHCYFPCVLSLPFFLNTDTTCFSSSTLSFSCSNESQFSLSTPPFNTLPLRLSESSFFALVQQLPAIPFSFPFSSL